MDVKIIPITQEYRENYPKTFRPECPKCLDAGRIVYGSDTETGRQSEPCSCKLKIIPKQFEDFWYCPDCGRVNYGLRCECSEVQNRIVHYKGVNDGE